MKICAVLLLALLFVAPLRAVSAAPAGSVQDRRAQLATHVDTLLGGATLARVKPLVEDAQRRIVDALLAVDATYQTPMQILDVWQKRALRRARRAHQPAHVDLRPDQRSALAAYADAIATAVGPIARDDGRKIEVTLTPMQRNELDALRIQTKRGFPRRSGFESMPITVGALADIGFASAGAFVRLVEIDIHAIAKAVR